MVDNMLPLFCGAWLSVLVIGFVAQQMLRAYNSALEISNRELAIGALIGLPLAFIVIFIGWYIAWSNATTFHEYWNGWELQAIATKNTCRKDGDCKYEYSCEPYWVTETYTTTDIDGKTHTKTRQVRKHHDCPAFKSETQYVINDTLGQTHVIGEACVNSLDDRWRDTDDYESRPFDFGGICVGPPQFWSDAKARIDSGFPGPVTGRFDYKNWLLAADASILKAHSGEIDRYLKLKLLPGPTSEIRNFYFARKAHFVDCPMLTREQQDEWQLALSYLNGGLGEDLRGDLHLVISCNEQVNAEKDAYLSALKAYWSDTERWGKDTIAKNTIIIFIGSEDGGQTTSFARATTGMPEGNTYMEERIATLFRQPYPMDPQVIIGGVRGEFYNRESDSKRKVRTLHADVPGILESVIWGLDDPPSMFVRACMSCEDEGENGGGLNHLKYDITPKTGTQIFIWLISTILVSLGWVGWAYFDS